MTTDLMPQNGEKLKSYWNRPSGKFGTIVGLGLLGAAAWFLFPILTTMIWNTINLMIASVIGLCLGYIILDGKLFKWLFYMYEISMKAMYGLVIETDPFIVSELDINDKEKKVELFGKQQDIIAGKARELNAKIKAKEQEKQDAINKLTVAQKREKNGEDFASEIQLYAETVGEKDQTIKSLTPLRDNLMVATEKLKVIHKSAKSQINIQRMKLSEMKDRYETAKAGANAFQTALSLFTTDPDQKRLQEQADQYILQQIGQNLANMQRNMDLTTEIIRDIDLQNGAKQEEGFRIIANLALDEQKLIADTSVIKKIDFTANKNGVYVPASENKSNPLLYNSLLD